jgi:hypothetical protein
MDDAMGDVQRDPADLSGMDPASRGNTSTPT